MTVRLASRPENSALSSSIVLVLIPGGSSLMGSQGYDESLPHYDRKSLLESMPPHPITVSPYFISKFEMTQAQWQLGAGSNPSDYKPGHSSDGVAISALNPVTNVTWEDAVKLLRRWQLDLPTEAQWEFAARGGTTTTWWTGDDALEAMKTDNFADAHALRLLGRFWDVEYDFQRSWSDGHSVHAPVDAFSPNPFGLLSVLGNVREWCRDSHDSIAYLRGPVVDPYVESFKSSSRVVRGGAMMYGPDDGRVSRRREYQSVQSHTDLGLRPSRDLQR